MIGSKEKFEVYGEYKDSGVNWISEIPAHWSIKKGKYLFKIKKRIVGELGYQVLSITQKGIKVKDIKSGGGQLSMDYSKYQLAEIGDFGMNHMDLLTGFVDISKYRGVVSPDYRVFSLVDKDCYAQYFLYLFQMGYRNKIFYALGQGSSQLGRWRLPATEFNLFRFPYPSKSEQIKIANFLDHKTQQIDNFIQLKEKTIALLEERKAAIINQAVTKGLDAGVEMKDSGIEWLGEIPKHWEVKKLKYFTKKITSGGTPSMQNPSYWNGSILWVSPKDMKFDRITKSKMHISDLALRNTNLYLLPKGTLLLVVRSGILQRTLPVSITDVPLTINQDLKALVSNDNVDNEFFYNLLKGCEKSILFSCVKAVATVESIEMEYFKNFELPIPPIEEQKEIIKYIKSEVLHFNKILAKAKKEIQLIKEYRQSLISAAVTGKIKI